MMSRSAYAVLVALAVSSHASTYAAEAPTFWSNTPEVIDSSREVFPASYRTLRLDTEAFKNHVLSVPHERDVHVRHSPFVIMLPLPDGAMHRFRIVEAPVMAPALINVAVGSGATRTTADEINSYIEARITTGG